MGLSGAAQASEAALRVAQRRSTARAQQHIFSGKVHAITGT